MYSHTQKQRTHASLRTDGAHMHMRICALTSRTAAMQLRKCSRPCKLGPLRTDIFVPGLSNTPRHPMDAGCCCMLVDMSRHSAIQWPGRFKL